jgi:hypothetical protein
MTKGNELMTASTPSIALAISAWSLVAALVCTPSQSHAAGSAYQVDTGEAAAAGDCKVDSWVSFADKRDFVGAVSPSCAVPFRVPLELGAQFNRSRTDGEWDTAVTPKFKFGLVAGDVGRPNVSFTGTVTYDFTSRAATAINFVVPASVWVSNVVRINANAGWLFDRTTDRHYLSYGLGVDLRTPDNFWMLTSEVFGQALNSADPPNTAPASAAQLRYQVGLRYRPSDEWSMVGIYGRNITGNNGNWFTLATVLRFPPKGE